MDESGSETKGAPLGNNALRAISKKSLVNFCIAVSFEISQPDIKNVFTPAKSSGVQRKWQSESWMI
jgi:hypothetical protein